MPFSLLVIDDDLIQNKLTQYTLDKSNLVQHYVIESQPEKALIHSQQHAPTHILVDYRLPGTDTRELIQTLLKQHKATPDIFIFSAFTDELSLHDIPGIKGILQKPLTASALNQALGLRS